MRWATHIHQFLKWFPVAAVGAIASAIGLLLGAAQLWSGVKIWTEQQYGKLVALAGDPLLWIVVFLLLVLWLMAFLWSGQLANPEPVHRERSATRPQPDASPMTGFTSLTGEPLESSWVEANASMVYYNQAPPTTESVQAQLYCSGVLVEAPNLSDDLLLKIFVLVFNGSPFVLKLGPVIGNIRWAPYPNSDDTLAALAPPRITFGGDESPGLAPVSDGFLQINQYVPRTVAESMITGLDQGGWVLDFGEFDVRLRAEGHDHLELKTPIWESVAVRRPQSQILRVDRIITAVGRATL